MDRLEALPDERDHAVLEGPAAFEDEGPHVRPRVVPAQRSVRDEPAGLAESVQPIEDRVAVDEMTSPAGGDPGLPVVLRGRLDAAALVVEDEGFRAGRC